jgi:DNA-binding GntR family transcriptional regulator
LLPTELEISRNFGVSRHTVRDALRILNGAGLIQRRRRVGTIVTARGEPEEFVQPLLGFQEIIHYVHDIRLVAASYDSPFDCKLAEELKLDRARWLRIEGLRGPEDRLIGVTTVIVRRDCVPPRAELEAAETSLGELLRRCADIVISRIEQEITAVAIDRPAARLPTPPPRARGWGARRLYYDQTGALFVASESLHPGDRFSYRLNFASGGAGAL